MLQKIFMGGEVMWPKLKNLKTKCKDNPIDQPLFLKQAYETLNVAYGHIFCTILKYIERGF